MQQLKSLMVSHVEVVRPNSTLREAAHKMKRMDVGALPVCDGDRVLGMITDRDIVIRVIAEGLNPDQTRASEVMTRDVLFCFEDQSIQDAAEQMREKKVGRLVVLSREHKLKGIISLGNLSRHLGEEHLADFVADKLHESEGTLLSRFGFGGLGTVVGVAALLAGVYFWRGQSVSEDREKIRKAA